MARSYQIAIADEDPSVLANLQACLMRARHSVIQIAASGEELMACCRESPPDLLIASIRMPLEKACAEHEVPIIALYDPADPHPSRGWQASAVITGIAKPIREDTVLLAIPYAMACHSELQRLRVQLNRAKQDLHERKLIEKAKGLVMERLKLCENESYQHLQRLARDQRRKLVEVAEFIVTATSMLSERRNGRVVARPT